MHACQRNSNFVTEQSFSILFLADLMILFNSIYPKVLVCSASDLYENPDLPSLYCSVSGMVGGYIY